VQSRLALLLIDFINPMEFDGAEQLAPRAVAAARHCQRLKRQAAADGVPIIYVNDNFGDWSANFTAVVDKCEASKRGRALATLLRPDPTDLSILKPRHSAFYGTPLEFLLDELMVDRLILAGLQAHICVLFTAHDAYLRQYRLWVPADCVASERAASERAALDHLQEVARVDVRASSDFPVGAPLRRVFDDDDARPVHANLHPPRHWT